MSSSGHRRGSASAAADYGAISNGSGDADAFGMDRVGPPGRGHRGGGGGRGGGGRNGGAGGGSGGSGAAATSGEEGQPLLLEDDGDLLPDIRVQQAAGGTTSSGGGGGGGNPVSSSDFASSRLIQKEQLQGRQQQQDDDDTVVSNLGGAPFSLLDESTEDDDEIGEEADEGLLQQRKRESSLSNLDTIIHLLKGNIGTGILAMPDAIKNSGLLVGNVGLVFMATICVHCMHMLVKCAQELSFRSRCKSLSYPEVAEKAFAFGAGGTERGRRWAGTAKTVINVFLCITQLGFCCVYFVFCSQNIKLVMDHHFGHLDYHTYMGIILLPMLALCSIKNLKFLAPFSMLANVLQMAGLGFIFFYLLQDLPRTWERKAFASWGQLPLYFGTAIYAFEGIGVVLPLENQMREPRALRGWNGVLNTAMILVSCLYIAVGFFGYLKYGDKVAASITLNLPVEQWLAQIIILMFSLAIFFSYALQFYVPIEIMLPYFESKFPDRTLLVNYGLRYAVVLITFALAAAIPRLDLFISLVGAASSSTLALMAPPLIDTITFWPDTGRFNSRLIKNACLFTIGFVGFLTGSYVSLKNIITYFITGR